MHDPRSQDNNNATRFVFVDPQLENNEFYAIPFESPWQETTPLNVNGEQDCIEWVKNGVRSDDAIFVDEWNDAECNLEKFFLCRRECARAEQQSFSNLFFIPSIVALAGMLVLTIAYHSMEKKQREILIAEKENIQASPYTQYIHPETVAPFNSLNAQ